MATPVGDVYPMQKRIWYRTTLFNAFVIGGVGFMAPGLWNALGAGGAQSPFLVNAANALVFGLSMLRLTFFQLYADKYANKYSGLFMLPWWPNCQQDWAALYPVTWCCWIPDIFVCVSRHVHLWQ
jgi:hypothetical protein